MTSPTNDKPGDGDVLASVTGMADDARRFHAEFASHDMAGKLDTVIGYLASVHSDLKGIKQEVAATREVVTAWNNVKGFAKTMAVLITVGKWITGLTLFFGAIYVALTHGRTN